MVLAVVRPIALVVALALAACGADRAGVHDDGDATDADDTRDDAFDATKPADTGAADATDTAAADDADDASDASGEADGHAPDPCPWEDYGDGLVGGAVAYAAFDPRQPAIAFAAAGGELTRSLDGGDTFAPWAEDVAVARLAFPPDDSKSLLAATTLGLYQSADSGKTFTPLALGGLGLHALLLHPASPQRVFVGTEGAGIMRSDDGGATFRAMNVGVPRMIVEALAAPGDDADVVLAGGILQSDSLGPGDAGVILRSDDGGATWRDTAADAVWVTALAVCPTDPRYAVAAARKGLLASRDGGASWDRVAALDTRDVIDVAFAAGGCDRLWASVYQEGVYRLDGDALTPPSVDGLDIEVSRFAGLLAADPRDRDALLVTTHGGLFKSADAGRTWRAIATSKGLSVVDLAADGARLWLTTWGGGLWTRTGNVGWSRVRGFPRDFTWLAAPVGEHLVVGSASDVWVAKRSGTGFVPAPGLLNATAALALADSAGPSGPAGPSEELLVTTQVAGLMRSSDPTIAWTPSNDGLAPFPTANGTFIDARAIAADPTRRDRLYLALRGAGVAVSDDRGAHWTRPENALANDQVIDLAVDASGAHSAEPRLYALVNGQGVWVSTDGAQTWSAENRGLDSLGVGAFVLDAPTGRLYASEASGDGVIKASDDGLTWDAVAAWCLPIKGWGPLAIGEAAGDRFLIATSRGNRVLRYRLGPRSE